MRKTMVRPVRVICGFVSVRSFVRAFVLRFEMKREEEEEEWRETYGVGCHGERPECDEPVVEGVEDVARY